MYKMIAYTRVAIIAKMVPMNRHLVLQLSFSCQVRSKLYPPLFEETVCIFTLCCNDARGALCVAMDLRLCMLYKDEKKLETASQAPIT